MMEVVRRYDFGLDPVLNAAPEGGPDWLVALRQRGRDAHTAIGIPNPRHEEWKYTPLRDLGETQWELATGGPAFFDIDLPRYDENSVRLVMVNGRLDRNLSDQLAQAHSIFDALNQGHPVIDQLGSVARIEEHTFGALNTAVFSDGILLHFPRESEVEPTIEILHITTGSGIVCTPRILIVAEPGSSAKIVETYITDGEPASLTLPVTEAIIHTKANIEHVRVQDEQTTNTHIGLWEVRQEESSEYRSYNVAYGAALARTDQGIDIQGENCVTRLDGVVVATGEQLLDNHTRLDHAKPNCNSYEIYKQVIDDSGTVVFNGKIFVHPHAQKTDAEQTNQALLLSPRATINSKPQLEIFADDVKCTHGATVGQLEDLPMFYMQQRGVPKDLAESLLVYAFAAEVLELISMEPVKRSLERRLFDKLGTPATI